MNHYAKLALGVGAGLAVGRVATKMALRRSRRFLFDGKRVLITGGSRGLGLVLARQLVDQGAAVALIARTETDLDAAGEELTARGGDVLTFACDIRDPAQVKVAVDEMAAKWGGVDVLFNVAGIIEVGPLDSMTLDDFQNSMATNCWGALHTVLAVLPYMRERHWGRIVNVASIGGKRAVPHMLPYAASKFALVGLSNGLRAELAKENILVTTASPSLMRTGSPRNAIFKGRHREEYAWFSIGDSLPGITMSAEDAAHKIIEACRHGDGDVMIRNWYQVWVKLQLMLPDVSRDMLAIVNRLLPEMGGIGQQAVRGYESQSQWSPSWLTQLTEIAARRNNEMGEGRGQP